MLIRFAFAYCNFIYHVLMPALYRRGLLIPSPLPQVSELTGAAGIFRWLYASGYVVQNGDGSFILSTDLASREAR